MPKIESNYIELHIYNPKSGKFLLLKRAPHKIFGGTWQMITASCEEGESTKQTAVRELAEETGLEADKLFSVPHVNTFYFDINNSICLSPVFLAYVSSKKIRISDEHTDYKWVSYEKAVEQIHWPDQIESLNVIWKYISHKKLRNKLIELEIKKFTTKTLRGI